MKAIDFAEWLAISSEFQKADTICLKIDIEGAEYAVLPHLLSARSLCRVNFLIIEWHLHALPASRRLFGLGLRNSLEELVNGGCPPLASPRIFMHEEFGPLNGGLQINGLLEDALRRTWYTSETSRIGLNTSNYNSSIVADLHRYSIKSPEHSKWQFEE